MNLLKRALGPVWLLLAAVAGYYGLTYLGLPKLLSGKTDDLVFGSIIVFILLPLITGGLAAFGWFALRGDYSKL